MGGRYRAVVVDSEVLVFSIPGVIVTVAPRSLVVFLASKSEN
jgi:hypothetical protein